MTGIPTRPRPRRDSTAVEEPLLAKGREIAEIVRSNWAEALCAVCFGAGLRLPFCPGNLPVAEAGCWMLDAGANSGEAAGLEGEVRDVLGYPEGSVHALSPPDTQDVGFDQSHGYIKLMGIVRPIHGSNPSALRAPGPAFGCPNSLPANLSNPRGFVHTSLSARYAKRPFRGALRIWRRERDSNPR
jgi:hypothetical protein